MLSDEEIRAIAQSIVVKAKATARYDQGTLFRSIAFTYVKGVVTFRQIYYGDFNGNSKLEMLAAMYMPKGVPYKIELTEFGGGTYEVGKTKQGRSTQKKAIKVAKNYNTTTNLRNLVAVLKRKREKEDGEEED